MNAEAKNKPVHEVKFGRIKAAIWANQTDNGVRHSVSISRVYKDGDNWNQTSYFGREDLTLVAKVADLAHTWIYENSNAAKANQKAG